MTDGHEKRRRRIPVALVAPLLLVAVGLVLWWSSTNTVSPRWTSWELVADRVMGTEARLVAVRSDGDEAKARQAVREALSALADVEAKMSRWIEASEVSRLNDAPAGKEVALSNETLGILRASQQLHEQTRGAFDVTVRPLILLWIDAGKRKRLPTEEEIRLRRAESHWTHLSLSESGATKSLGTAGVDLGGIAKGYGTDLAVEALRRAGCDGGLVDVGGDIRCFGPRPGGGKWRIGIRSPFDKNRFLDVLELDEGAVCTSGNYERFTEIEGKRYSHIIDPRTGRPVDRAPSVSVFAPTAMVADAWATALSVLGEEGLKLLPDGVEAMLVIGGPTDYQVRMTEKFRSLLVRAAPASPIDNPR